MGGRSNTHEDGGTRYDDSANSVLMAQAHEQTERVWTNLPITRLVASPTEMRDLFQAQQVKVSVCSDTTDDGDEDDYVEGGWGLACLVRPHISSRLD